MGQEAKPKQIVVHMDDKGNEPYLDWLNQLKDIRTQNRIAQRVERMASGNYGDFKSLKDGVFELRFTFGAGYRVYFGEEGDTVVILLFGGDKSTQHKDIEKAKKIWKEYYI